MSAFEKNLAKHVALIGMMGAGKSAIGRRLASAIGTRFVDSDQEIEKTEAMSITQIFADRGETAFRACEQEVIGRFLRSEPGIILALGGGAIASAKTCSLLDKFACTVWIRASKKLLLQRVTRKGGRPLLEAGDPSAILDALLQEREPLYSQADIVVDSVAGPHEIVVQKIITALSLKQILREKETR